MPNSLLPHKNWRLFLDTHSERQGKTELHFDCESNNRLLWFEAAFQGRRSVFGATAGVFGIPPQRRSSRGALHRNVQETDAGQSGTGERMPGFALPLPRQILKQIGIIRTQGFSV